MKTIKRVIAALLALMLIVGIIPLSAGAQDVLPHSLPKISVPDLNVEELSPLTQTLIEGAGEHALPPSAENEINATTSGPCGNNLTWKCENNDLTISGTGAMYDYSDANPAPWSEYAGIISSIIIEEGVTTIGDHAFAGFTRLNRVYVYANISNVGSRAFEGSVWSTPYFMGDAPDFADDAFAEFECRPYYFRNWDTSVLQNYGGEADWNKGTIGLSPVSKQVYALNEKITADDLVFYCYATIHYSMNYTPGNVVIGEYDNSTYGQKTVPITVDGTELTYTYMVSDGENHLDLITVDYDPIQYAGVGPISADPVVRVGDEVLMSGNHYTITYENNLEVGANASFTITGKGIYEGYQRTYPFAILKMDLSNARVAARNAGFYGQYMMPKVYVEMFYDGASWTLTEGEDYQLIYEDNVNVGTGTVRAVGIGNYCGTSIGTFQITQEATILSLDGTYNGNANEDELNDEYS